MFEAWAGLKDLSDNYKMANVPVLPLEVQWARTLLATMCEIPKV